MNTEDEEVNPKAWRKLYEAAVLAPQSERSSHPARNSTCQSKFSIPLLTCCRQSPWPALQDEPLIYPAVCRLARPSQLVLCASTG